MSKSEKRNSEGWAELVESVIMELGLDTLKQYTDDILSECKGEMPSIYMLDVMGATEKRAYEAFTHAMKEKNIWSEFLVKGVKSTSWTIYDAVEFLMSHDAMNEDLWDAYSSCRLAYAVQLIKTAQRHKLEPALTKINQLLDSTK